MLKNVPKILSPELIKVLCEMGHGDEIVIGDANFPSETYGRRVIRADGLSGTELLNAILTMIPLDSYSDNFMLMDVTKGDPLPDIWDEYINKAKELDSNLKVKMLERFEFYDRASKAYAVIASGEERVYANIILKKGVIK